MMGAESTTEQHLFGSPPAPPREEMESLVLTDDQFQSAMETSVSSSSSFHPLSAIGDPSKIPNSPSSSSSATAFLEPPSYADAIFTPLNPENGRSSYASSSSTSGTHGNGTPPGSIFGKITVSDPQQEQEASSSLVTSTYVTYLITTRTLESECSVRRRFRDFVTLADRLAETYRGFFVPIRPDKSVVESQVMHKQEFVEQRRSALEKYLRRLAAHPVIGKSEELRVFLQVHGKLPLPTTTDVASRILDGAVRLPKQLFGEVEAGYVTQEVAQPAKGGRDLLRIFKELKQSVTNDWSGTKPLVVEEDRGFLERKEKMKDLEQQLSSTSQQAEGFVKAQQDIGETLGELGLAFVKLTKFETDEAIYDTQKIRAADIRQVATAAVKASRFYRESNAQTVNYLDTLHEYLGIMIAVHSAFSDRYGALLTVQTLVSDLSTLQAKAEKLETASSKIFGGDRSRIRKVEEMKETIRITENAKDVAIREYEKIKENNRNELERLDKEMHDDFLAMLKGFVVNQVGYAEKIASVWEKVVEETYGYAKQ